MRRVVPCILAGIFACGGPTSTADTDASGPAPGDAGIGTVHDAVVRDHAAADMASDGSLPPVHEATSTMDSHVRDAAVGDAVPDVAPPEASPADAPHAVVDAAADSGPSGSVEAIAAGSFHTCALLGGGAWCWGYNDDGELGDGTFAASLVPVRVKGLSSGVTALAAADQFTCAIVSGAAMCWGYNAEGELGNGMLSASSVPVQVLGLATGVTAIATNFETSCAIANGEVACWSDTTGAVKVEGITGATAIAEGSYHTCVIVSGAVECWGLNNVGQLGDGTYADSPTPAAVKGLPSGVTAIAARDVQTCAVANHTAYCWGYDGDGLLGNGSVLANGSDLPLVVPGLTSVTAVSMGALHTCALNGGDAFCWGSDLQGQLGDGTMMTGSLMPLAAVGVATPVTLLSAGGAYTCAGGAGGIQCWGFNADGQLGNGSMSDSLSPVSPTF